MPNGERVVTGSSKSSLTTAPSSLFLLRRFRDPPHLPDPSGENILVHLPPSGKGRSCMEWCARRSVSGPLTDSSTFISFHSFNPCSWVGLSSVSSSHCGWPTVLLNSPLLGTCVVTATRWCCASVVDDVPTHRSSSATEAGVGFIIRRSDHIRPWLHKSRPCSSPTPPSPLPATPSRLESGFGNGD